MKIAFVKTLLLDLNANLIERRSFWNGIREFERTFM